MGMGGGERKQERKESYNKNLKGTNLTSEIPMSCATVPQN